MKENRGERGNRRKKRYPVLLLFVLLAFLTCGLEAKADFGDSNDYDYGGSDDFGGFDDDYDYDGYDDYGGYHDYGIDGGYSSGGSGYGGGTLLVQVIILAAFFLILYLSFVKAKEKNRERNSQNGAGGRGGSRAYRQPAVVKAPERSKQIEGLVRITDLAFASADFIAYAKNVFLDMQTAWMERDLSKIRPLLHENLYDQTQKQVDAKIGQGLINKLERISVQEAFPVSCCRDETYEYLTVYLRANMVDYQVEEKTGNLVSGDRSTLWELTYRMKFMRTCGARTEPESEEVETNECPHCGAPLEDAAANVCPYCGSVIRSTKQKWVLCDFGSVKNSFPDEGVQWKMFAKGEQENRG